MHKALRTPDILEIIFGYCDIKTLGAVSDCCHVWRSVVTQVSLWTKLANNIAEISSENLDILSQKGLDRTFSDSKKEFEHFRELCEKFDRFTNNWSSKEPTEVLLNCSPEAVNKNFNFSWEPWWWWKNKGGWIAGFAIHKNLLLCGVIETLQLWNLETNKCEAILSTPRDDYVQGVDIALNCLDLLDNIAVSGSNEGVIRVWDVAERKLTRRLDCSDYGAVNSVRLVPGDQGAPGHLLSGHDDGQLVIWSITSARVINLVNVNQQFSNILWCIDFSDEYVAACSEDMTITIFDKEMDQGDLRLSNEETLNGHESAVTCVSIRGQCLVSGGRDKCVRIWARQESGLWDGIRVFRGHEEILHFVAQDEDRIYSSDDGGELFVWKKENDSSILRRVDYGDQRGAIDCIKLIGTKVFLSYDDFGSVAIQDYW